MHTDRDGWNGRVWVERSKVVLREADRRIESLRSLCHVRQEGLIGRSFLQNHLRPLLTDHGLSFGLELAENRIHEVEPVCIVASALIDELTCAQWIIAGVTILDRRVEQTRSIWINDDRRPGLEVVNRLTNFNWVIVEVFCEERTKAKRWRTRGDHLSCHVGDHGTDDRSDA